MHVRPTRASLVPTAPAKAHACEAQGLRSMPSNRPRSRPPTCSFAHQQQRRQSCAVGHWNPSSSCTHQVRGPPSRSVLRHTLGLCSRGRSAQRRRDAYNLDKATRLPLAPAGGPIAYWRPRASALVHSAQVAGPRRQADHPRPGCESCDHARVDAFAVVSTSRRVKRPLGPAAGCHGGAGAAMHVCGCPPGPRRPQAASTPSREGGPMRSSKGSSQPAPLGAFKVVHGIHGGQQQHAAQPCPPSHHPLARCGQHEVACHARPVSTHRPGQTLAQAHW